MKLSLKGMVLAGGILWALALFLTGVMNLVWPPYGETFLKMMASLYPGYHAARSIGHLIIGTLYAFFDGAILGLAFGWLYNWLGGMESN